MMLTFDDEEEERPKSRTVTSTMSVGLIVKMFWNKLSQFQYVFDKTEKQAQESNQSLMKLENDFLDLKLENDNLKKNVKGKRKSTEKENSITQNNKSNEISNEIYQSITIRDNDIQTASTQTFETAFLPCEYCNDMKENLLTVGARIIDICEKHRLPSSLSKQKRIIEEIDMNNKDIKKWSQEEGKDIDKINLHITKLGDENVRLGKKIKDMSTEIEKLTSSLKFAENELSAFESIKNELKSNLKTQSDENIKLRENVKESENATKDLQCKLKELTVTLEDVKNELNKEKKSSQTSEETKEMLSNKLKSLQDEIETLRADKNNNHKNDIENLQLENKQMEEELHKAKTDLNKSIAENKILLKHDESLQKKISNLLLRLEKMEEEHDELNDELNLLKEENESLNLDKTKLRQEINVKESSNQERDDLLYKLKLVINYPVHSKKYQTAEEEYERLVSRSEYILSDSENGVDVVKDMRNQYKANDIRISVLKEENQMLEDTLEKLQSKVKSDSSEGNINGIPIIDKELIKKSRNKSAPMTTTNEVQSEIYMPRPPSEPRKIKSTARPRSASKTEPFDISSKLAQLDKLKNLKKASALVTKSAWNESNTNFSDNSDDDEQRTEIICPDCDKTYLSDQDLAIHRNFCYGRI